MDECVRVGELVRLRGVDVGILLEEVDAERFRFQIEQERKGTCIGVGGIDGLCVVPSRHDCAWMP